MEIGGELEGQRGREREREELLKNIETMSSVLHER